MNMNQSEIEWAASRGHACPNVRKGIRVLHQLMLAVNEQSDGWAYWSAPSKASLKLQALLQTAGNLSYDTDGTITEAELRKAISPIRRMAKLQEEKQKEYGNKFHFDVDAALYNRNKRYEHMNTHQTAPLPWTIAKIANNGDQWMVYSEKEPSKRNVCNSVEGEANAQLIVHSVNTLPALLAALRDIAHHCVGVHVANPTIETVAKDALKLCDKPQ